MTNLADLLPAGGGQNNTDFVADGNISAGAPVILTAAGKAAAVAKTPVSAALNDLETIASGTQYTQDWCYDTVNDKIVVIFSNSAYSSYPYYVIGTVTSEAVSWTTPTAIFSRAVNYISCCYNATEDRIVMCCEDSSLPKAIVGTSNGSSITWGSSVTIMNPSGSTPTWAYQNVVEWSGTSKVVWCGTEFNTNYQGYAAVATLSGSAGSATSTWDTNETTFTTAGISNAPKHVDMCYDYGTGDQVIILYAKGSTNVEVIAGAISGTTLTFGSPVVAKSSAPSSYTNAIDYDTGNSKALIVYGTSPTSGNAGTTNSRVISTSGSTITLEGTETAFIGTVSGGTTQYAYSFYKALTYAANSSNFVFIYESPSPDLDGYVTTVSISGTTITWSNDQTEIVAGEIPDGVNRVAYDPDTYQAVLLYRDGSASNYLKSQVYTIPYDATNLTATNLLGLAPKAISNTATGTINTWGSRCESTKLVGEGPSAGANATYAPTPDDPYRYSMCYDTANDKVIIAYNDEANSYYLYACVGTVTGNAISWGTVVAVDETATMDQIQLTYDTNADRVLLVFRDQGTGGDLSGRVGTVSGTTISFGSKTTGTPHPSGLTSIYDPTEQKHLLSYLDNNNSNYGYSCVATVTGGATNTVAFGTQVQFSSSGSLSGDNLPMCYYTSETKIIMKYDITSTGRYAVACTISGTSVSFGTAVLEYAWGTYGQMNSSNITYDSTANKAVSVDGVNASPHALYAAVISLSGTTITWGTPVVVNANSANDNFKHAASIAYSSAGNNFLIAYSDDSNSSYLYGVSGTLSGTSTTWGTPVALRSVSVASDQETDLIYDPDSQNFVVAYRTATPAGESNVVSIGDLPLTVTSDYYVQTDGTISTTSTSPAQLIGKAIKTNQINIKDYTG